MINYIIRRFIMMIPVFILCSMVIFLILHLVPGNPIDNLLHPGSPPEAREQLIKEYGLDKPIYQQYIIWLTNIFKGNLGVSITEQRSVSELLLLKLPNTVALGITSLLICFILGIFLGAVSAIKQNTIVDYVGMVLALLGVSVPTFWLGLMLMLIFSVNLGWFPISGYGDLKSLVLPAFTLGLAGAGLIARITRASMLEIAQKDYIAIVRAKGISNTQVIIKHIFRNALIPIITLLGLRLGWIIGGAVTTEIVFNRPGLGRLLANSLFRRDYPVIQGALLILIFAVMVGNLIADILYAYADPQIRYN
ncbi:MAG: ABC transporter permease [Candidatus Caldatribacteriota bacterium]|nr:ABC transporter permease [Candidatus Caldatribacteriota bacterium]